MRDPFGLASVGRPGVLFIMYFPDDLLHVVQHLMVANAWHGFIAKIPSLGHVHLAPHRRSKALVALPLLLHRFGHLFCSYIASLVL